REYNGIDKMFNDTIGTFINKRPVNYSKSFNDAFYPYKEMVLALSELSGKPAYKYRASELLFTLALDVYKAIRRLIVPPDIDYFRLLDISQSVFDWDYYHLYDFTILGDSTLDPAAMPVPFEEDLDSDPDAILMDK